MPAYKDTKRGTWYSKYSYTDRITGKRKQVLKRGFATKKEALSWEMKERSSEKTSTSMTFNQLSQKYYDYRKQKDRTIESQSNMVRLHFPYIDDPVEQITKTKMMEWYFALTDGHLAPGTVNLVLTVVKSIFAFGAQFYELPNPASSLKRMRTQKRKYDTWSVDEFNRFISKVDGDLYVALFTFMYWTGCRKGEALGLQYTDIKDGVAHIHQQMTGRHGLSSLKTEASERSIKLIEPAMKAIEPFLEACSPERPFVFGGESVPVEATVHVHFQHGISRSGVKPIRIHDLRHSFATNAICSGASIVAVSKYLGHSSITITLDTYTHLLEKADDEMIGIMNKLSENQ